MFENKIIYDDLKDENLMAEIGILQFYNHDFTEIIQLDELLEYKPKIVIIDHGTSKLAKYNQEVKSEKLEGSFVNFSRFLF